MNNNTRRRGFSLAELAIVMAVLGVLLGGLFQLTAASSRTLQDQVTAQQLQQYMRASKSYLAARMQVTAGAPATVTIGIAPEVVAPLAVNSVTDITARVQNFRAGLSTDSPAGSTYVVRIRRLADIVTTGGNEPMFALGVFLTGGNELSRVQMGSISTLVGAEGAGVFRGSAIGAGEADNPATAGCNEAGSTIRSAFGAACINSTFMDGALPALVGDRPAALSYGSPNDFSSSTSQWLSRTEVAGAPQMTTMSSDLRMGGSLAIPAADPGNDIIMLDATNDIFMNGGNISDIAGSVNINDTLNIRAGGNLTLNGGNISDPVGNVIVNDGLNIAGGNNLHLNGSILGVGGAGGILGVTFANGVGLNSGAVAEGPAVLVSSHFSVGGVLRASSFVYSSDERLKKDIKVIENATEKLGKLRGVTFTYKKNGKESVGIIAQDVEKEFPQLVTKDADGYRGVEYMGLVGPIIQSINELAAENKQLKLRIEQLEKQQKEAK